MDTIDILVRFEIPILTYNIVSVSRLTFHRWIPLTESESITLEDDGMMLKFWFDMNCLGTYIPNEDELSRNLNIPVDKIFVDVTLRDIPLEFAEYMKVTSSSPHPSEGPWQEEYRKLGQKIYIVTLTNLNRFLQYVKNIKGQYWVAEYPTDKVDGVYAVNLNFNAMVQIGNEWFKWFPDVRQIIHFRDGDCSNKNRYLDKESWIEVKEFMNSQKRVRLVMELLAGAEWLAGMGHRRSALTEAVTALEVAIFDFAQSQKADDAFGHVASQRLNIGSLKKQVEHFGLSGTISFLFPIILTEDIISTEILKHCQDAIQQRNNVVHNGQRDVNDKKLLEFFHSIRALCTILEKYS